LQGRGVVINFFKVAKNVKGTYLHLPDYFFYQIYFMGSFPPIFLALKHKKILN